MAKRANDKAAFAQTPLQMRSSNDGMRQTADSSASVELIGNPLTVRCVVSGTVYFRVLRRREVAPTVPWASRAPGDVKYLLTPYA